MTASVRVETESCELFLGAADMPSQQSAPRANWQPTPLFTGLILALKRDMGLAELEPCAPDRIDLDRKRLLIFIVAYNAQTTIEKVLTRIPASLHSDNVEVLIIDDSSQDDTFVNGLRYQQRSSAFKITVLKTPENQGYGGNQKLGYRYAIDNGFDIVALIHGDGQYAPEKLPILLKPLIADEADAVVGSRMIETGGARRGGMPLYKRIGNRVLTAFE